MTTAPAPRVLVVAPLYHPDRGGLGRQAVLLTERLAELGAVMTVATRAMSGLPDHTFSPRVEIVRLRAGRPEVHNYERPNLTNLATSLRFTAALNRLLLSRRHDFDLLHVHGASLPLLGVLPLASALGKPVIGKVAALHQGVEAGDLGHRYGPLGPLLVRLLRQVATFVATTAEIERALLDEGYAAERIARIPNFVDVRRFSPPAAAQRAARRAELGLAGRTVALHSGRLAPRKAVDVLLRAWRQAVDRTAAESPLLVILGDGPERARLEALTRELALEPQVRFVGFCEQVEHYLFAADVFVLASRVEGFPNALLEAMGCGLPCLATRLGGALEAIEGEREGLLVPVDAPAELSSALQRLLGDVELRARLGAAAAARVDGAYTLNAIAPRYLKLYRELA